MDFKRFENSLFYQAGRTRLNPLTLEYVPPTDKTPCVYDCILNANYTDVDDFNLHLNKNSKIIQYLYLNFEQSIRTIHTQLEWIPQNFKSLFISQRQEVKEFINNIISMNVIKIHRHRFVITPPGFTVHSHRHYIQGSTVTIAYILDIDNENKSFLMMTEDQIPVEIPRVSKFLFHMKGDPIHGAISNHWICWHYTDFDKNIVLQNNNIIEISSKYFTN